jgi:D-glycero-D-manno-heptose 1,7-bisphosphate phosphatase
MKRPAIFFDRDNTLIVSDGYLGDPSQVVLVDGAANAVARARELGYATVVFSNQSGVARGLFTEDDVRAVNSRIDELLRKSNPQARIDAHEYCPFHPQAVLEEYRRDSDLRKPRPGMIHQAEQKLELDLSRSWVIGDAPRDIEAGIAAGCGTILFKDPTLPASEAAEEDSSAQPDEVVSSLNDAMDFIESSSDPVYQKVKTQAVRPQSGEHEPRHALPEPQPTRLERLTEQMLQELRRRDEPASDFSVPRLMAGIMQVIALAVLFMSYLNRADQTLIPLLLLAIFFQLFTIGLLIMGRLK